MNKNSNCDIQLDNARNVFEMCTQNKLIPLLRLAISIHFSKSSGGQLVELTSRPKNDFKIE